MTYSFVKITIFQGMEFVSLESVSLRCTRFCYRTAWNLHGL